MYDLGNLSGLCSALNDKRAELGSGRPVLGEMHCPQCSGVRRMAVEIVHASGTLAKHLAPKQGPVYDDKKYFYPQDFFSSTFKYFCTQCDTRFTAFLSEGRRGEPHLAIFPSVDGGLATPRTPRPVAYYLDQAQRCRSTNANSAAIAMYRAALEQLLFDKGFKTGMLDAKIKALEAQIGAGTPPTWARDLETEYLRVMKELGNGAVHANGGDVSRQAAFDDSLLIAVEKTFLGLLDLAYEQPIRRSQNLGELKSAAALVRK